jgi:lysophospholipase L1-like esterase
MKRVFLLYVLINISGLLWDSVPISAYAADLDIVGVDHALWCKQWAKALPIGNGHLGAIDFGGILDKDVQSNEYTTKLMGAQAMVGPHKQMPYSCVKPNPRTAESAVTPVNRSPKEHRRLMALKQKGNIGLLFLGASITEFWPSRGPESWAKLAPFHPANFGVSGDCTENLLWRITNGELDGLHPKVVVLNIGNNNIGQHPDERPAWAAAGVRKVLDVVLEKLPDTKVILLGIFPRGEKNSPIRRRNDAVNREISRFANGDRPRYLDIAYAFLEINGELSPGVMRRDKEHPSARGYQKWYEAMNPVLVEMMK